MPTENMSKAEFLELVRSGHGEWLAPEALAPSLALHLPEQDRVAGWLWLARRGRHNSGDEEGELVIVGDRLVVVVNVHTAQSKPTLVHVESVLVVS